MVHSPILLLDKIRCRNNIKRIAYKAEKLGLSFRPHFKTHQSIEIGRWFREFGINGITVSSIGMAKYFVQDDWDDITIAFPFYHGMIDGLKDLQEKAQLRLFLNREGDVSLLNNELKKSFKIYIEIDAGYGRSGISITEKEKIKNLISVIKNGKNSEFHGFYIHDGGTYKAHGKSEIKEKVKQSLSALRELKKLYPEAKTSLGDTPSASVLEDFDGIDEITPGNLVFYDWMQVQIGSCNPNDVAVSVKVPFSQRISKNKVIVHGGAVHFSKDYIEQNGYKNYGQAFKIEENGIVPFDGVMLSGLSQEHGTLSGFDPKIVDENNFISILPIHSCLTVNLYNCYHTTEGEIIQKRTLS
ncbi:alanine racemase [Rhodohalobacter sp.]|uniref:alanine racemase n=1 Tax=Rhodohalobacter sp. TaxID=1974210 RepID=UPI00356B1EA1